MQFLIDTNAILYFLHDRLEQQLPKGTYFFSDVGFNRVTNLRRLGLVLK